jgi:glycerol-3-phosphate dehydrogenase
MNKNELPHRNEILQSLRENPAVSVLIVGAGVNGIGTFRDLALQGIDVLMIDKNDFCSGASAASSHMVHGGIRYLENGEFRLVREAVRERNLLIENAPHYVKPLPTNIPIFKNFSGLLNAPLKFAGLLDKPGERGALVIKIGLMVYDAYTGAMATVPKHQFVSGAKARQEYPLLHPDVRYLATYYDGAMESPERICIDLLRDGKQAHPQARALNYVRVGSAAGDEVTLHDELSGETLTVQPQLVINAAGPWIDFANADIGAPSQFIGGTKGSHLVLEHPQLREAIGDHEFFFENDDGRIVLIFPLRDRVMIGTSDLPIDNPDDAVCTDDEVDYFFGMIDRIFPNIKLSREQIVFRFSGVRPLPTADVDNPGQISRDHSIKVIEEGQNGIKFPIYSLVGGKWTSFRALSEEAADEALAHLGQLRRQTTDTLPIGGGRDFPHDPDERWRWTHKLANQAGVPYERMQTLVERYGSWATSVADFCTAESDAPLTHHPDYTQREIIFIAQQEQVVHLDDLILRRTLIGMLGQLTGPLLAELAEWVGAGLGWSDEKKAAEVKRTAVMFKDRHGINFKI